MPIRPNMEASEYLTILRRYKWFLIFSTLIVLFVASLYCALAPKRYKSTTTILLIPQKVPENYVRSTVGSRIEDRMATLQQEVMSRTRLLTVVNELQLFGARDLRVSDEETVTEMRKRIEVQVRGTGAFSISFIHEDPKKSMMATSRLASFFIDENLRQREQQAVGTSEFLESQLQETKSKLEAQEERVKRYKLKFSGELPQQTDANLRTLARLQEQVRMNADAIRSAEDRKAIAESQVATLERSWPAQPGGQGSPGAADASQPLALDPGASLVTEYNARRTALTNAMARYTDRHPEVLRLRREVEILEARIADAQKGGSSTEPARRPAAGGHAPIAMPALNPNAVEVRRLKTSVSSLEIEIASLKREGEDIRKSIAGFQGKVDQSPAREQELVALNRDYDNLRRSYDDLLSKKLQADISQNLERRQKGEQFQILDPANIPQLPFEPKVGKIYLLSFAGSLMIGLGGIVAFAYLDETIRSPEEFRHFFKLPLVATLPAIQKEGGGGTFHAKRDLLLGGYALVLVAVTVLLTLFGDGFHSAIRKIGGLG